MGMGGARVEIFIMEMGSAKADSLDAEAEMGSAKADSLDVKVAVGSAETNAGARMEIFIMEMGSAKADSLDAEVDMGSAETDAGAGAEADIGDAANEVRSLLRSKGLQICVPT